MTDNAVPTEVEPSPDFLAMKPQRGTGVRRLNRVPIFIATGLVCVVMAVVGYTMYQRQPPGRTAGSKEEADASPSAAEAQLLRTAQVSGVIDAALPPPDTNPADARFSPDVHARDAPHLPGVADSDTAPSADRTTAQINEEALQWRQRIHQIELQRLDEHIKALESDTQIEAHSATEGRTVTQEEPSSVRDAMTAVSEQLNASRAATLNQGVPPAARAQGATTFAAANGQGAKREFMNEQPVPADYLKYGRADPVSPYEVNAGTVIPANMIGGVNSDLPGMLLAQVSENIYDSATGRLLLIPQGSKLIGTYDNGVTFGQSRVLVGWQRILYPDGSSIDLGRMPGADESGYAGFKDKMNNHLLRLFSQALLLSVFSAGVQLGQPQASSGNNYNSSQIVAAAIAQQMGELGMEIVRRNMDQAPTLEIRPGYSFNVMVTKDMVIRPRRDNSINARAEAPSVSVSP